MKFSKKYRCLPAPPDEVHAFYPCCPSRSQPVHRSSSRVCSTKQCVFSLVQHIGDRTASVARTATFYCPTQTMHYALHTMHYALRKAHIQRPTRIRRQHRGHGHRQVTWQSRENSCLHALDQTELLASLGALSGGSKASVERFESVVSQQHLPLSWHLTNSSGNSSDSFALDSLTCMLNKMLLPSRITNERGAVHVPQHVHYA